MISAIVCVDSKWAIGKDNHLLFDVPADMKFFREKTTGHTVCMGYNTLLSFPGSKPLKNRKNIVLSQDKVDRDDCLIVNTLDDFLAEINKEDGEVFIIGGASIYKLMLPYYDRVYVTKVDADGEGTVFFPNLDKEDFTITEESDIINSNGYDIKFVTYERK